VLRGLLETRALLDGAATTLPPLPDAFLAGLADFFAIVFIFFNFAGFFAIRLSPKQIGNYYLFSSYLFVGPFACTANKAAPRDPQRSHSHRF
jgi:hypothetical protein